VITVRRAVAGDADEGEALASFLAPDLLDVGDRFTLPDGLAVVAVLTRERVSDAGIDQTVYVHSA
jgi:hypothetical protein